MTLEDAYLEGFCKAAEAMNVNPLKLAKTAQSAGSRPSLYFNPVTDRYGTKPLEVPDFLRKELHDYNYLPAVSSNATDSAAATATNTVAPATSTNTTFGARLKALLNGASQGSVASTTNGVNAVTNKWNDLIKQLRVPVGTSTNAAPAAATNAVESTADAGPHFNPGDGRYHASEPSAADKIRGTARSVIRTPGSALKRLLNGASQGSVASTTNGVNAVTNKWNDLIKQLRSPNTNAVPTKASK